MAQKECIKYVVTDKQISLDFRNNLWWDFRRE